MKKILLILAGMFSFLFQGYSQASFNTGAFEVDINQYGRVRLLDGDGTTHLERSSILVGTSVNAVFDYENDAGELDSTRLVASPQVSDFEIYGSYDNSFSGAPPDIIEKINAYGWNNGDYTIVKFNIQNNSTSLMNAMIGLDNIPEINGEYGFDTVTYNSTQGVIRFHRGNQENMGIKLLSAPLASLYSFEWFTDYTVDSLYWGWMNYGSIQPQYVSTTSDGPVAITSQASVPINAGETRDVYYAYSLGPDEATMMANMAAAVAKYNSLFTSVSEIPVNGSGESRNFPNPFKNTTTIKYEIPSNGLVSLKVFDAIGNEITTLVNTNQEKGIHTALFDAGNLSQGIYYYTLNYNNQTISHKMLLVK